MGMVQGLTGDSTAKKADQEGTQLNCLGPETSLSYVKNHPQKMSDIEDEMLKEPSNEKRSSFKLDQLQHPLGTSVLQTQSDNRSSLSVSHNTEFESKIGRTGERMGRFEEVCGNKEEGKS